MDFTDIKKRAFEIKNKVLKYSSEKLSESNFTINSEKELIDFIEKSVNTKFTSPETKEEKIFIKKVIVLF